jgi:hypothetical protein
LIDTLSHIQEGILDYATSGITIDIEKFSQIVSDFNDAISLVRVTGEVTVAAETTTTQGESREAGISTQGGT